MAGTTPHLVFQTQRRSGGSEEADNNDDSGTLLPPREEGWGGATPLFRLQGWWLTARLARSVELVRAEFRPRPDDVLLATFPKAGTTWLKALAFALVNRSRQHPITAGHHHNHPLLGSNPHDLVPFLELPDRTLRPVAELEALPSPRLLCTHLPPALLPPGVLQSCRAVVYLCREPKDVFVSYWHHVQTLRRESTAVDLDKAFELFCEGASVCGPVWEHYLEYWKLSTGTPDPSSGGGRVLFLRYEEMMAQPAKHVRKLAEFLDVPFTEEEEESVGGGGVVEEVVRLCSFRSLKDLPVNAHGVSGQIGAAVGSAVKNSLWFRRGKVGDWENHLTPEMARRLDCIVQEKLKGTGLTF